MLQFENSYGEVRVIEKAKDKHSIIRVAAYCRVSTDLEMQQTSLDTQIAISKDHNGKACVDLSPESMQIRESSGTSVKHREEFKRMVADAREGKIDYIIAKSISRFARNTVDTLAYVRELKSYGVSVFFEKEKLDTGNAVSEFLLSIFAAAAQEEIISLSNNMKVGRRMRYAAGIAPWVPLYGFRKGENGEHLIDENEAAIVRRVFREYIFRALFQKSAKDPFHSMDGFSDVKLLIAGRGPEELNLKRQVELLQITDSVTFLGFLSQRDLNTYISESLAFLVNTQADLNMISVPESVCSCTPVIMNEVPLSSWYIKKFNLGVVKKIGT